MAKRKNKAFDKSKWPLWIDPEDVTEYEKNAKIHTEKQIHNIANSIKRFGWQQDTVLTTDNVIVIGHGRRLAAICGPIARWNVCGSARPGKSLGLLSRLRTGWCGR